jgi:hypothetical protein
LAAPAQTNAKLSSCSEGNERLADLIPLAQRIQVGINVHGKALLDVVELKKGHSKNKGAKGQRHNQQMAPAHSRHRQQENRDGE